MVKSILPKKFVIVKFGRIDNPSKKIVKLLMVNFSQFQSLEGLPILPKKFGRIVNPSKKILLYFDGKNRKVWKDCQSFQKKSHSILTEKIGTGSMGE